jgi:DHA1 family bicyclomycin/chloramphenicol resistance-like MFS transporter
MARTSFGRASAPGLATLVLAASVGPLAMNVFLPSLPGMARYFQTDYGLVQLTVSLYLAATAALQLIIGPASDRFGRRPVLMASLAIFLVATIAAIYAPNVHVLLVCRVFQAFATAGIVLSRAIVRDTVDSADAASKIGYITMGMSVTPMVAPLIGGLFDEIYGWQASFWLTFLVGLLALAVVFLDLGETNRQPSSSFGAQFRSYPELLRSRRFWGYTATATLASGAFFAFLGGGPYVASEILGLTPSQYGFYFGIISVGYMAGNFISGRYARRMGMNWMMLAGGLVSTAGLAIALGLFMVGMGHPLSLFGPVILLGLGNGMTLPSANAGIVSVKPHLAGSASGLGGALTIGGGAALSAATSAMLSPETGVYPLLVAMLASSLAGIATAWYLMLETQEVGEP